MLKKRQVKLVLLQACCRGRHVNRFRRSFNAPMGNSSAPKRRKQSVNTNEAQSIKSKRESRRHGNRMPSSSCDHSGNERAWESELKSASFDSAAESPVIQSPRCLAHPHTAFTVNGCSRGQDDRVIISNLSTFCRHKSLTDCCIS